jgi:PAS domain S-box-containing protein
MAFDLGEFHRINRTRIIGEWVRRLHAEVGEQYSRRPLKELQGTISEAFNGNYHVIVHEDYKYLNQFIDKITPFRLKAGFLLSDVQKAFEIYRSVILPLLAKEVPTEEFIDCVYKINRCLAYAIPRFTDLFQAMHEKKILDHNRKLEEEVRVRTSQLRESELKYKTLVEEINDGYFVIQDEVIVFANRAYCEMHGYSIEEVLGKKYYDFVAPESRDRVIEIYNRSRDHRSAPDVFEYVRLHKEGGGFPTEITAKVTRYENRFSNIGICRDISKRVEMERRMRESERMAYIGQITTSLSHEIRNPLSAVKMNLQILSNNPQLKGNDQRRINISVKEMIRLEGILTELLDFAKPLQMDFGVCNVNHILSSYTELIKMRMKEEGFRLALRLDDRVPEIEADGEKIGQVFMNLLLNAIEASPAGARVFVRSKYHNGGGQEKIEIAVMDEGSGVPKESVDEIFKPFFTTKSKGTGLGLANVKRIIEGHGGWVEVKNRTPKGASFAVFLPVGRNDGQNTHHR